MKRANLFTVFALASAFIMIGQVQGKDFKGIISYKITFTGAEIPAEMQSFMPKMLKTSFSGALTKTEMLGGAYKTISIKNGDEKSVVTLIDMMGNKVGFKATEDEIKEEITGKSDVKVEIMNETKEILGYECKKALITTTEEGQEIRLTVYFTDALGTNSNYFDTPEFKDIEGIMLEFQMVSAEFTMNFTASSIEEKKVPESEFEIPAEYKMMTKAEFESQFGGGM